MIVEGKQLQSIWLDDEDKGLVRIIDQRYLPFQLVTEELRTPEETYRAIQEMHVRGAPLIGVTAALGMYLALMNIPYDIIPNTYIRQTANYLKSARPTAVNLGYAVDLVQDAISSARSIKEKTTKALEEAKKLMNSETENCRNIGLNGLPLIRQISEAKKGEPVNILTHCNAGWLACVDYGTATAPIYMAHDQGIKVHVWIDETRPRNQGAKLTAWELAQHGVPCTLITDNAGGHLMQQGMVDIVLVGSDRTSISGDVTNKIGTYLKALAAKDNKVPFYAALPSSSIDWGSARGSKDIVIEERDKNEVRYTEGLHNGKIKKILITGENIPVSNPGFDVTPSGLVTGLITERGICKASEKDIKHLFPEKT